MTAAKNKAKNPLSSILTVLSSQTILFNCFRAIQNMTEVDQKHSQVLNTSSFNNIIIFERLYCTIIIKY